ncbi:hypothetical protein [Hydrogenimonas sp.]
MIYGLTPVKAAQAVLEKMAAIEVNALLQVGITVLKQERNGLFLIRMGQHTFTTKSDQPLEPGRGYWVEMAQTKEGIVHLRRLHPKPLLLQKSFPETFDLPLLQRLAAEKDPGGAMKEAILHRMAQSGSKEEFTGLTQLLLSMHQGVLTLPVRHGGRETLLQMRQRKANGDLNQKSVEFYASMNNIGPVEGVISTAGRTTRLALELYYPKSVALLERHKGELEGFGRIEIRLKKEPIAPFWDGSQTALLDIKG